MTMTVKFPHANLSFDSSHYTINLLPYEFACHTSVPRLLAFANEPSDKDKHARPVRQSCPSLVPCIDVFHTFLKGTMCPRPRDRDGISRLATIMESAELKYSSRVVQTALLLEARRPVASKNWWTQQSSNMNPPSRSHERKRFGDCVSGGEHAGPVLQSMPMVSPTEDAL